ncbi:hypothetical protein T08_10773, partial [Trichinella sp. T8]
LCYSNTVAIAVKLLTALRYLVILVLHFNSYVVIVRRVTLCKCDGKHCRWHSATCTLCYSNTVAIAVKLLTALRYLVILVLHFNSYVVIVRLNHEHQLRNVSTFALYVIPDWSAD